MGLPITEVPINWTNVPGSKVNLVLDAILMFRDVFRFRVLHRNVSREQYEQFERSFDATERDGASSSADRPASASPQGA